ncbi:hypothetical protein D9757_010578 [Collybiopsis confluens]|uniref:Peptidase M20 dimerisation domain-containing protein n=1 Tax=Collybiopsis confluens TaxID=2823264 RepID=A0A8H5LWG7_9AGAR|nr:hypothetical protein D9757_010578 [Collybiopsis confluens]
MAKSSTNIRESFSQAVPVLLLALMSPASSRPPPRDLEETSLLPGRSPAGKNRRTAASRWTRTLVPRFLVFLVAAALLNLSMLLFSKNGHIDSALEWYYSSLKAGSSSNTSLCRQTEVLVPESNRDLWVRIGGLIDTGVFQATAISWLSGAVRVKTETFDDMGLVGEDPRWENRKVFHEYLEKTFPLVQLEKVNTYGLLYTWEGIDPSLKPALLMAHFDVVPVNPDTVEEWTYPPYSGYFDGESIWGRGSKDDKSALISTITSLKHESSTSGAIEVLLLQGFRPERTFLVSFGFDEEAGGHHGASKLAEKVLDRYGKDSFAFIIDEGGGFSDQYGTVFATPGVAEKGNVNVDISVAAPGGHSSSIGILAALLVQLEQHPFEVHIDRDTPTYQLFQCFAQHASSIPSHLRDAIKRSIDSDKALREAENIIFKDKMFKSLLGTTQAVDIIHGGVKSNALPEQAYALVNHRIATTSSVKATQKHAADLLLPLAKEYDLSFSAFGHVLSTPAFSEVKGNLTLSSDLGLEPAPVSPTRGKHSAPYQLLSGTIKATYNAHRDLRGDNVVVGPGMPTGNTDTKYFWELSEHIFRYNHHNGGSSNNPLSGAHTVNEVLSADALMEMIRFFVTLILNADEFREI